MSLALLSLFLAAFSLGTAEWVIAGLVPAIAQDLNVDVPTAGLLVSGYAIGVAIGGPILSLFISRFDRKSVILSLMGVFIVGQIFCAVAPSYALLMAARVFVSLMHGTFFGVACILAASIAEKGKEGTAISYVFSGISVANIVGVPAGTAIGNWLGWRATFWAVDLVAVAATVAMAAFLPHARAGERAPQNLRAQAAVLGRHQVWLSFLLNFFVLIAYFITFTFVAPLVEASGVAKSSVPLVLLINGVGAVVGTTLGGRLTDWSLNRTLIFGYALCSAALLALAFFAGSPIGTAIALAAGSCAGFATAPATQNRALKGSADAPDLAANLMGSAANAGIAAGAWIGATLVRDGFAYPVLPLVSGILTAAVAALAIVTAILDRPRPFLAVPHDAELS